MVATERREENGESNSPRHNQRCQHHCGYRKPSSHSDTEHSPIRHNETKLGTAERNDLHELDGELSLKTTLVPPLIKELVETGEGFLSCIPSYSRLLQMTQSGFVP